MPGHLVRGVVEQAAHRFLRHLVVDQPGAEGVPPLVWGDLDRAAELVADVAGQQPLVELTAEGGGAERQPAVEVTGAPGQQVGAARELGQHRLLLGGDRLGQVGVDGHERLAAHLVVGVVQVGGALAVADDAVQPQPAAVTHAQPGAHQDPHQQPAGGVGEAGQVLLAFQLGHHRLRQRPWGTGVQPGVVLAVEIDPRRQAGFPAVLAGRAQQPGEAADLPGAAFRVREAHRQVRQVGLDQLPGQRLGSALQRRERRGEPGDGAHVGEDRGQRGPGGQPPAGPAFGQRPQPGRLDPVEAQHRVPAGIAQPAQQPHIARILRVPADAVGQVAQVADRVQQEPALDAAPLGGEPQVGVPLLGCAVQQRVRPAGRQLAQQPP